MLGMLRNISLFYTVRSKTLYFKMKNFIYSEIYIIFRSKTSADFGHHLKFTEKISTHTKRQSTFVLARCLFLLMFNVCACSTALFKIVRYRVFQVSHICSHDKVLITRLIFHIRDEIHHFPNR